MAERIARLVYASTEQSADQLYLTRAEVPDAFLAMEVERRKVGVLSALEFDRICRTSALDDVLSLEKLEQEAREHFAVEKPTTGQLVMLLALRYEVGVFRVPNEFPAFLLREMEAQRLRVEVTGGLFHERETKTREQAEAVREGNAASSAGFSAVEKVLRESRIEDGYIVHEGQRLTSERLRFLIAVACLERGAIPSGTIVAGGDQGCDPHERGSGPLKAHELIIVDIFPRVSATGYHGDMTRTYIKGEPADAQRKLVATVKEAHGRALKAIKAGVDGIALYKATRDYFDSQGYRTEVQNGRHVGFFHGLGHGLGLEVHEPPRMGRTGVPLKEGHVVTVEPGLYYPGVGGCRIEDVVWVTQDGCEMLSEHAYEWIF